MVPPRDPTLLPLTDGPSRRARARMAGYAQPRDVPAARLVLAQGHAEPLLYVVVSGALASSVTDGEGRRSMLAVLTAGDVFGEASLHPADAGLLRPEVSTLARSRLLAVSAPELLHAARGDPELWRWLAAALLRLLERHRRRLVQTVGVPLAERLRLSLTDLAERTARPDEEERVVRARLTQETLGALVGASRESVNRTLRALTEEGVVHRQGRTYAVGPVGPGGRPPAAPGADR
jgi:CRP/FNR family transcriptional regulator, cyclic AMP receptor protein